MTHSAVLAGLAVVTSNGSGMNDTEGICAGDSAGDSVAGGSLVVKVISGTLMSLVILATILGNLLVISAVLKMRSLRTRNNYFIVSLAAADLLVGVMVQPFNMYNEMVQGEWNWGEIACDFYNSNDVFFSTASLLHLCCISCDRYMAILHPFLYKVTITKRRVFLMIAGSWVLSALLSYVPIFSDWYTTPEYLKERSANPTLCTFEVSRTYAFISSSISFWIPCVVMVILYQRILTTALRQEREIQKLMVPAAIRPPEELSETEEDQISGLIQKNHSNNNIRDRIDSFSNSNNSNIGASDSNGNVGRADKSKFENNEEYRKLRTALYNGSANSSHALPPSSSGRTGNKANCIREVRKLRKEHRAAKTLGIIMGSFILCMGPIFLWYTITFGICPSTCDLAKSKEWVITLVFWVGYFNSCMNPFIYAFFNRDFQNAFKRLLQSFRKHRDRIRRSSTSSELPVALPNPLLPDSSHTSSGSGQTTYISGRANRKSYV